jgi:hypothetical protein
MKNTRERFVIKFNNGYWKTFDTWNYTDVEIFLLRKEAEARLDEVFGK